jgi:hypothetical protein
MKKSTLLLLSTIWIFLPLQIALAQQISITRSASASEADGEINLEVTLSQASSSPITVKYESFELTASKISDYITANDTLRFHPGTTKRFISVIILNDKKVEPTETFLVVLSQPSGATISNDSSTCSILDDDYAPIAKDDVFFGMEDIDLSLDVLSNDLDPDDLITDLGIEIIDPPKNGTYEIQFSQIGSYIYYTPKANFFGSDSLSYRLSDGLNQSEIAKVVIFISSVNDVPSWRNIPDTTLCYPQVLDFDPLPYISDQDDSIANNPLFVFKAKVVWASNALLSDLAAVVNPISKKIAFLNVNVNRRCSFDVELTAIDPQFDTSQTIMKILFNPQPFSNFIYNTVCLGKTTRLEARPVIANGEVLIWGWDLNGDRVFESNRGTLNHTFTQEGFNKIWVYAKSSDGCEIYRMDSVLVLPRFAPKILYSKTKPLDLAAQPAKSYQWYEDGAAIPVSEGGDQATITARKKAAYHYFALSEDDCQAYSDTVVIDASRLDNLLSSSLKVFPNPSQDLFSINLDNPLIGEVEFVVSDLQGRVLAQGKQTKNQNLIVINLDISHWSAGMYSLTLELNGLKAFEKILKNR